MKCLSVRQPWAWMIINAGKDIENRDWYTKVRGRVLIHAAKGMTKDEYEDAYYTMIRVNASLLLPSFTAINRGGIIGSVEIADCVQRSDSPWFFGRYGFVLRDPQRIPFTPYRGQLGFFDVDAPLSE